MIICERFYGFLAGLKYDIKRNELPSNAGRERASGAVFKRKIIKDILEESIKS
jgi:hypothetical protein